MTVTIDTMSSVTLSSLLPSTSYTLVYALPLLFSSLILTYAGAFLTLDRTRTFAPRPDAMDAHPMPASFSQDRKKRFHWYLEGGFGGLATGYAFGVHFATFLALLIPSLTTSAALGTKSFLAVWILSAIFTTISAGRWKYVALGLSGISGGATLALGISVLIHPALLTRQILISIFTPLLALSTVLPIPPVQHHALRLTCSSTGAFGLVVSIACLAKVSAWEDVWVRLWVSDGANWGTSSERGLTAGYCLFLASGVACDGVLKRKFGENPDQKWDAYLANYTKYLPNAADRAGQFQPLTSFWSRWFGHDKSAESALLFPPSLDHTVWPTDDQLKSFSLPPYSPAPGKLQKTKSVGGDGEIPGAFDYQKRLGIGVLRKGSSRKYAKAGGFHDLGKRKTREAVKFRPLTVDEELSSDDDDVEDLKTPLTPPSRPGYFLQKQSYVESVSGSTVIGSDDALDIDKEKQRVRGGLKVSGDGTLEYSDYEEDVTVSAGRPESRDTPGWTPGFIRRASVARSYAGPRGSGQNAINSSASSSAGSGESRRTALDAPPPGAVPMTPSLIKALDRISAAQQEAFSPLPGSAYPATNADEGLPRREEKGARWEAFWRDVKAKAG